MDSETWLDTRPQEDNTATLDTFDKRFLFTFNIHDGYFYMYNLLEKKICGMFHDETRVSQQRFICDLTYDEIKERGQEFIYRVQLDFTEIVYEGASFFELVYPEHESYELVTPNSFTSQYFPNINVDEFIPFEFEKWSYRIITKPQMKLRQSGNSNSQYWTAQIIGKLTNYETFGVIYQDQLYLPFLTNLGDRKHLIISSQTGKCLSNDDIMYNVYDYVGDKIEFQMIQSGEIDENGEHYQNYFSIRNNELLCHAKNVNDNFKFICDGNFEDKNDYTFSLYNYNHQNQTGRLTLQKTIQTTQQTIFLKEFTNGTIGFTQQYDEATPWAIKLFDYDEQNNKIVRFQEMDDSKPDEQLLVLTQEQDVGYLPLYGHNLEHFVLEHFSLNMYYIKSVFNQNYCRLTLSYDSFVLKCDQTQQRQEMYHIFFIETYNLSRNAKIYVQNVNGLKIQLAMYNNNLDRMKMKIVTVGFVNQAQEYIINIPEQDVPSEFVHKLEQTAISLGIYNYQEDTSQFIVLNQNKLTPEYIFPVGSEFLFEHAYCDWFYLKQIKINNLYCRGVVNGSQNPIVCDSNQRSLSHVFRLIPSQQQNFVYIHFVDMNQYGNNKNFILRYQQGQVTYTQNLYLATPFRLYTIGDYVSQENIINYYPKYNRNFIKSKISEFVFNIQHVQSGFILKHDGSSNFQFSGKLDEDVQFMAQFQSYISSIDQQIGFYQYAQLWSISQKKYCGFNSYTKIFECNKNDMEQTFYFHRQDNNELMFLQSDINDKIHILIYDSQDNKFKASPLDEQLEPPQSIYRLQVIKSKIGELSNACSNIKDTNINYECIRCDQNCQQCNTRHCLQCKDGYFFLGRNYKCGSYIPLTSKLNYNEFTLQQNDHVLGFDDVNENTIVYPNGAMPNNSRFYIRVYKNSFVTIQPVNGEYYCRADDDQIVCDTKVFDEYSMWIFENQRQFHQNKYYIRLFNAYNLRPLIYDSQSNTFRLDSTLSYSQQTFVLARHKNQY